MNSQILNGIKPDSLQAYLARTGWTKQSQTAGNQIKYQMPELDLMVIVPQNTRSADYGQAVRNLVRTISQIEERDIGEIVKNILTPTVDVLKFRFLGANADIGSLPFDYAMGAVSSIRDALIYSACSEINKQPMYNRSLKDASRLIEKSRFGQTELGSFVITVEMPLEVPVLQVRSSIQPDIQGISIADPIQRRVLARILRGAGKARAVAIEGESIDPENDYKEGLNANLAEALASLKPSSFDLAVELSASWDRTIQTRNLPTVPVLIEERTFESLEAIGNIFRGSISSREVSVTGRVLSLSRDESSDDDSTADNIVTVRTSRDDLPKNIRVSLNQDDYFSACNWHRDKSEIRIQGTLEKSGRSWLLTGYSGLGVTGN